MKTILGCALSAAERPVAGGKSEARAGDLAALEQSWRALNGPGRHGCVIVSATIVAKDGQPEDFFKARSAVALTCFHQLSRIFSAK